MSDAPNVYGTEVRVGDLWELDTFQVVEVSCVDGRIEGWVDGGVYEWGMDGSFEPETGPNVFDMHGLLSRAEDRK